MTLRSTIAARKILAPLMETLTSKLAEALDQIVTKDETIAKLESENDELREKISELEERLLKLEDMEEDELVH